MENRAEIFLPPPVANHNSGVRYGQAFYDSPASNPPPKRSTMIKLSRYFLIPFRDPAISLDELIAFATDHSIDVIDAAPR